MGIRCAVGSQESAGSPALACLDCGAACCPACAVPLESVTYCRRCAASLLEATAVRAAGGFDLH